MFCLCGSEGGVLSLHVLFLSDKVQEGPRGAGRHAVPSAAGNSAHSVRQRDEGDAQRGGTQLGPLSEPGSSEDVFMSC